MLIGSVWLICSELMGIYDEDDIEFDPSNLSINDWARVRIIALSYLEQEPKMPYEQAVFEATIDFIVKGCFQENQLN